MIDQAMAVQPEVMDCVALEAARLADQACALQNALLDIAITNAPPAAEAPRLPPAAPRTDKRRTDKRRTTGPPAAAAASRSADSRRSSLDLIVCRAMDALARGSARLRGASIDGIILWRTAQSATTASQGCSSEIIAGCGLSAQAASFNSLGQALLARSAAQRGSGRGGVSKLEAYPWLLV